MMPKGVEHINKLLVRFGAIMVKIPMMPKGVEHLRILDGDLLVSGEDSNDAERR